MTDHAELIAEARLFTRAQAPLAHSTLIALANALEAAERERDAALADNAALLDELLRTLNDISRQICGLDHKAAMDTDDLDYSGIAYAEHPGAALLARMERLEAVARRLTFEAFSDANRTRCESPDGFNHPLNAWTASDWMTAVVGELGEAANIIKKINRYRDGIPGNRETEVELRTKLQSELSDTFIYLDLLFQFFGFRIEQAVTATFDAKSAEIGYPVRFTALSASEATG